jgi:very-short-patch-repair endonuclease
VAAVNRDSRGYQLPPGLDGPIAALADRQDGIVEHGQLVALGYGADAIHHRIRAGRLHPRYRGVYSVGHRILTPKGHIRAAVLAYGPQAVASHYSAARLWNLWHSNRVKYDVTVPGTSRKSRPRIRVHRARRLHPDDITEIDGIPVISVARTILDLAALLRPSALVKLIEQAEREELFDLRAIDAVLSRAGGHRGAKRLKRALKAYRPPPTTKSGLERRMLRELHAAGMPKPTINTLVAGHEADLYFRAARLIVEVDGHPYHDSPRAFETDRIKDAAWQRAGQAVIRITDERMETDMRGAVNDVVALYAQRVRATGASP